MLNCFDFFAGLGFFSIISPGIDFVAGSVNGWNLNDQDVMPHAYKGGTQAMLLKSQIEAMPEGGVFAMVAPPNPYRCPPGPYERVSMVAHVLKNTNPSAKIIIADPKPKFSKMGLFTSGWEQHYSGMIEWIGPDFGGGNVTVTGRLDGRDILISSERAGFDRNRVRGF